MYYDRNAGAVTYVSYQRATYSAPWGSGTYGSPSWTYNTSTWGPAVTLFGPSVGISVHVLAGTSLLLADTAIPLTPNSYTQQSHTCASSPLGIGTVQQCYDIRGDYTDLAGSITR